MRAARITVMNLQSMVAKRLSQAQTQKLEARPGGSPGMGAEERKGRRLTPTIWPHGEREGR